MSNATYKPANVRSILYMYYSIYVQCMNVCTLKYECIIMYTQLYALVFVCNGKMLLASYLHTYVATRYASP